jgi:hypothetical protein
MLHSKQMIIQQDKREQDTDNPPFIRKVSMDIIKLLSVQQTKAQPEFFFGWGADPEAIYNFCLILKTILGKSCQNLRTYI